MSNYRLELANYRVKRIEFADKTRLVGHVLQVNRDELLARLSNGASLERVNVQLAHPGDSTRIVHLLDAVEPRVKVRPDGASAFPGLLGPPRTSGRGRTNRLTGVSVVLSGQFPQPTSGILSYYESIIEMSGPAAPYCACADTANLVVTLTPAGGSSNEEFDRDARMVALHAADYLARATLPHEPDDVEQFHLDPPLPGLPRVAFVMQIQQQGFMVNKLFYGHNLDNIVPTVVHPNEFLDGAIFSAHYHGNIKVPTAMYANHPTIRALYSHHGRSLDFRGVVMSRGYNNTHALKDRNANCTANVIELLGADAAILAFEGTGNTWIDLMLSVRECERRGIRAIPIVHELGGPDGREFPLVDCVPEAVSIVSTGSTERVISVPAVSTVIGGSEVTFNVGHESGKTVPANSSLEVTPQVLFGGYWQMGISGFRCISA